MITPGALAMLMCGISSCGFPFNFSAPCDIAPVGLHIETVDSLHVNQTIGVQAQYERGLVKACDAAWSSDNPRVLLVGASSTTTTTAVGLAPGIAAVKILIGTDSALARVTVTP